MTIEEIEQTLQTIAEQSAEHDARQQRLAATVQVLTVEDPNTH